MADLRLPDEITSAFVDLMPQQRAVVDQFLQEGVLVNYAVSLEDARAWAVFNANSEMEVLEFLAQFPLTPFMEVEVSQLSTYNTTTGSPAFSLN